MPGPPGGTFVADDDERAGFDVLVDHGLEAGLLAVENAGGAGKGVALLAGDLDDTAIGRQVAAQDEDAAGGLEGVVGGVDDLLAGGFHGGLGHLGDGAAVHVALVAVQQAELVEFAGDNGQSAGLEDVGGDVVPPGLEVRQDGHAGRDAVKVLEFEVHAGFVGNGHDVEHGVG